MKRVAIILGWLLPAMCVGTGWLYAQQPRVEKRIERHFDENGREIRRDSVISYNFDWSMPDTADAATPPAHPFGQQFHFDFQGPQGGSFQFDTTFTLPGGGQGWFRQFSFPQPGQQGLHFDTTFTMPDGNGWFRWSWGDSSLNQNLFEDWGLKGLGEMERMLEAQRQWMDQMFQGFMQPQGPPPASPAPPPVSGKKRKEYRL